MIADHAASGLPVAQAKGRICRPVVRSVEKGQKGRHFPTKLKRKLMEIAELGAQPSCIERSRKIARSAAALNGDPSNTRIDLSEHLSKCVYVCICYARNICICI